MTQGQLFDAPADIARDVTAERKGRTRASNPSTSHAAARTVALKAGSHRANVLLSLLHAVDGRTQEELWLAGGPKRETGRFPNHAQTRAEELAAAGLAHRSDRTRPNQANNAEGVWFLTDAGRAVAVELEMTERVA
jgi:hypothetical protein